MFTFLAIVAVLALLVYLLVRGRRKSAPLKGATNAPGNITVNLQTSITVTSDPIDEEIATLHREATALKGNDWTQAVALLQKAAALEAQHDRFADADRMVRLPIFLQQAGRFDEAMAEFSRLIERVQAYVQKTFGHTSELIRSASLHHQYGIIYDKMRLACKREKRMDLVQEYLAKVEFHKNAWAELQDSIDAEREKEVAAYDAKIRARESARGGK